MLPRYTLRAVYHREDPRGVAHLVVHGETLPEWVKWKVETGVASPRRGVSADEAYADLIVDNLMSSIDPSEADRLEAQYGVESGRWCWVTYTAVPTSGGRMLTIDDVRPGDEYEPKEAHDR